MKRLIAAIVLGALAAALCITGSVIVDRDVDEISGLIEKAMDACERGDLESAGSFTNDAVKKWRNTQGTFEFFTGNDTINIVDHSMERMVTLLKYEERDWFIVESKEAILNLERIAYAESFSLKNIM